MADLYVNGKAMSGLNWWFEVSPDGGQTQQPEFIASGLWSRRGLMVAGVRSFRPRQLTLSGAMLTAANTVQGRVTAEDLLADLLGTGLVTIRLDDGTTPAREIDGLLIRLDFRRVGHPLLALKSEATAVFLCPEGDWRATTGTAIRLSTARTPIPLGTAPSPCVIRVAGSVTNPTITYRTTSDAVVHQLQITSTLAATEYLDVDMTSAVIRKFSGGTGTLVSTFSVTGSFPFALDPAHGDYANAVWPRLSVSGTNGEVLYTKRYR